MSGQEKFEKVMHEFKEGTLESHDSRVTDRSQAIAIAYSEARKVDPGFGSVSLDVIKEIEKDNNDSNVGTHFAYNAGAYKGIENQREFEKIIEDLESGKSPEEVWLSIHEKQNLEPMAKKKGKIQEHIKKNTPNKLKSADKPSIEEEIQLENAKKKELMSKEEKFEKAHTFIENRDMYIVLASKKAYEKFVLEEFIEYGQKMPFGKAVRPFNDSHVYYYSDKLKDFLDKHNIHYTVYENKEELLEFVRSKVNI